MRNEIPNAFVLSKSFFAGRYNTSFEIYLINNTIMRLAAIQNCLRSGVVATCKEHYELNQKLEEIYKQVSDLHDDFNKEGGLPMIK
jgi:hypothetical protein